MLYVNSLSWGALNIGFYLISFEIVYIDQLFYESNVAQNKTKSNQTNVCPIDSTNLYINYTKLSTNFLIKESSNIS